VLKISQFNIIVKRQIKERGSSEDLKQESSSIFRYNYVLHYIGPNDVVLDSACGEGFGAKILASKAKHVEAIDYSSEAIKIARDKYSVGNISYKRADVNETGYKDNMFDIICAFEIIEHLNDPEAMLRELERVLKPSGSLFISTPNRYFLREKLRIPENPYHVREYNRDELRSLLKQYYDVNLLGLFLKKKKIEYSPLFKYYLMFKRKLGLIKWEINPKLRQRISGEIKFSDVEISAENLGNCSSFFAVCKKPSHEN